MDFTNKLKITQKMHCVITQDEESEALYYGDITYAFDIPMLSYAKKAKARFQYLLNEETTELAGIKEIKRIREFRKDKELIAIISKRISSYINIIAKLETYADYELLGIYPKGEDGSIEYVITPYNEVINELRKNTDWDFIEISKTEYDRLDALWTSKGYFDDDDEDTEADDVPEAVVEPTETIVKEETKFTLLEKIGFGLFLMIALPIVFYPFTLLAILYWSANPFNLVSFAKFVFFMIAIIGVALAFKIMSGEVKIKQPDEKENN